MPETRPSRRSVVRSISGAVGLLALSSPASAHGYDDAGVESNATVESDGDDVRTDGGDYNDDRPDLD